MSSDNAAEFRVDLRFDRDAARVAREFVRAHSYCLAPDDIQDAELLVSELVTNAVLHGLPVITLTVDVDPPSIGVAVHDDGPAIPATAPLKPADDASNGRGLLIVERIASSWGVLPSRPAAGKTVWFRLR